MSVTSEKYAPDVEGVVYRGRRGRDPHHPDGPTDIAFVSYSTPQSRKEKVELDLSLRLDLYSHSPTGFEWGYLGSGPSQLALAMCAHATGDDELALKVYQRFKEVFIAKLPRDLEVWTITREGVLETIGALIDLPTPEPPGVISVGCKINDKKKGD